MAKLPKDWPQLNFIIYHGCLQAFRDPPDRVLAEFDKTGEIKWASDLARIPAQYEVTNAALLRNFISFYHQAYRAAVWGSRHNYRYIYGWLSRPYLRANLLSRITWCRPG